MRGLLVTIETADETQDTSPVTMAVIASTKVVIAFVSTFKVLLSVVYRLTPAKVCEPLDRSNRRKGESEQEAEQQNLVSGCRNHRDNRGHPLDEPGDDCGNIIHQSLHVLYSFL